MEGIKMNMEHIDKFVPQNIKDALKDIGELSVIFFLYYYFSQAGWSVYRNYDEKGYDILLQKQNRKIKFEVKTRQRLISSRTNKNQTTHFTLTQIEKDSADYLIAFWLEHNLYFVVPTSKLKETASKEKKFFKFIVKLDKNGKLNEESLKYLGKWGLIK